MLFLFNLRCVTSRRSRNWMIWLSLWLPQELLDLWLLKRYKMLTKQKWIFTWDEYQTALIYIHLGITLTCLCSFHFNYSTSISGYFSIIEWANPYSHFYWRHYASDFKEWMDTYLDLNCNYHNMVISKNWIDNQVI